MFPFARTQSKSSLAAKDEEEDRGHDAKNFLMSTAKKSLMSALEGRQTLLQNACVSATLADEVSPRSVDSGAAEEPEKSSSFKEKKKKTKDKKKMEARKKMKKKKKKGHPCYSACNAAMTLHPSALTGESSSDSSDDDFQESSEESLDSEDVAKEGVAVFGLRPKDLQRPQNAAKLDDLQPRQIAFVLSCTNPSLLACDLIDLGGELVPWLQTRVF